MNRLYHLSQTLPVNIAENSTHPNLEFILLNYNSKDDMDNWVKANMSRHIESGLLKYFKTDEPEHFNLAHSKNLVAKLATGDIICNVDADNYAGPDYAGWVEQRFAANGPDTIVTTIWKDAIPYRDQGGKICFSRDLFRAVNGYDESLIGYGMDDVDMSNRLEKAGGKRVYIEEEKYLRYIAHSFEERIVHYRYPNNLEKIYLSVAETSREKAKFLYLFKDGTAAELSYVFDESAQNNPVIAYVGWTIAKDGHREASFQRTNGNLLINFSDGTSVAFRDEAPEFLYSLDKNDLVWQEIKSGNGIYFEAMMAYNECLNRLTFAKNDGQGTMVNKNGFGKASVRMNFDAEKIFQIS